VRSALWLALAALLVVTLAVAFSWVLYSPEREYLFDGVKGQPRPELAEWWRLRIPAAVALGTLVAGLAIVLLRTARGRAWLAATSALAVTLLGTAALTGTLFVVHQRATAGPVPCEHPIPRGPNEVFLPRQWTALSLMPDPRDGRAEAERMGPLRDEGVGLERYPGILPFDPFLLDRVTFMGLTLEEVESLLGPPAPARFPDSPSVNYHMAGTVSRYEGATLVLSLGSRWERSDTVKGEHLRLSRLPGY